MDQPNQTPVEPGELPVESTAIPPPAAKRSRLPLILLSVVLLVGVGVGGFFAYRASVKNSVQEDEASLVAQAQAALESGDLAAAVQAANGALALTPAEYLLHSQAAVAVRGQALALQEKYAEALPDLNAALADDPQNALLLKLRGKAYQEAGKTADALQDFAASLAVDPSQPDLLDFQARAALAQGDLQAARRAAEAAGKLDEGLSLPYAFQAEDLYASRIYTQTIAVAAQAIQRTDPPAFAYRLRGSAYYWMYDLANAQADLDKALELDPQDAEALGMLALLAAETNQAEVLTSAAERASLQAAKTAPGLMAQAAAATYNYDEATARLLLDEAIALAPERPELYILRSDTYTSSVGEAAWFADLDTALGLDPDLRMLRSALGYKYLYLYDLDKAEEIGQGLVDEFPAGEDGYDILTGVYCSRYELRKALETVEKGLLAAGESSVLYNARGDVYQWMGKDEEAIQDFEKALTFRPNSTYALLSLAAIASDQGKPEEALQYIQQALDLNPGYLSAYINRAYVYEEQDKQSLADADRKKASAMDIRDRYVMLDKVNQYHIKGEYRDAKLALNTLEERYPLWPEVKIARGWILLADNDARGARTQAETVLKAIPNHPDAHLLIGWIEVFDGNYDLAQEEVDAILSVQPLNADAYSLQGNIYSAQADAEKTEASFLKALEIDPQRSEDHFSLGMLHFQQEKNDQAIQDFQNALKYGENDTAEVMLKSLQNLPEGYQLLMFADAGFVIAVPKGGDMVLGEEGKALVFHNYYETDTQVYALNVYHYDAFFDNGATNPIAEAFFSGWIHEDFLSAYPTFKEGELVDFKGLNTDGLMDTYSMYSNGYRLGGNLYFFSGNTYDYYIQCVTPYQDLDDMLALFDQVAATFGLLE